MFELTRGELALVIFLFALVWIAGRVPRVGERLGGWIAGQKRGSRRGTRDQG